MTFELLISTMHKKDDSEIIEMLNSMNIKCNCVVVNQCDEDKKIEKNIDSQNILILFTKERGLSRSRNMAIENSTADIVAIADDDLFYYDNFEKKILDYYSKNISSDIVLFNMDNWEKKYPEQSYKCVFFDLSGFTSMQITFKREKIKEKFNILFGSGSKIFDSGEENIFLVNCYKAHNKIFYCSDKILKRNKSESSWFKGYNDEKYISDRGAVYYAISRLLYPLYIIRFAFAKRNLIKPVKSFQALKLMKKGKDKYKKLEFHK